MSSIYQQGMIAVMDEECLRPGEENDQVTNQITINNYQSIVVIYILYNTSCVAHCQPHGQEICQQ